MSLVRRKEGNPEMTESRVVFAPSDGCEVALSEDEGADAVGRGGREGPAETRGRCRP